MGRRGRVGQMCPTGPISRAGPMTSPATAREITTVPDRFHVNSELAPGLVTVRGPEAHHMAAVCRVRPGDAVCLFNGDGREYPGRVIEATKRDVTVEVTAALAVNRELPFRLVIACALPKGDRAQFLVEKLTELGVSELILLETERTVVHPRETKLDRLERYVIEASKQCGRNVLMPVRAPRKWAEVVRDASLPAVRLIAHPGAGEVARPTGDVVAAVGPEGGFTDAEGALAREAGWRSVSLGERILRIETAALALAARLA
jgi:16S rRNA (uracil1498-N3)-methyltransferase